MNINTEKIEKVIIRDNNNNILLIGTLSSISVLKMKDKTQELEMKINSTYKV